MTTTPTRPTFAPMRTALSWRLLVAWTLASLLPSLAITLPVSQKLGELFDRVPNGNARAGELKSVLLFEALRDIFLDNDAITIRSALAFFVGLTLLAAPFTAGLAAASYPAPASRFGALVGNAFRNYGKMFRLQLWSLVPMGVAMGAAAIMWDAAARYSETAVLESKETAVMRLTYVSCGLLFLTFQFTVEMARGRLIADPGLTSAFRAWVRGVKLVWARPFAALARFVVPTTISLTVAALITIGRFRVDGLMGLVLTQLAVAAIGCGRTCRVLGLAELSHLRADPD